MTAYLKKIFKKKYPQFVSGDEVLSPYFDLFEAGFEFAETSEKSCDSCKSFEEWKAAKSSEIEELADYFMAHDTEHFFTGDKFKEAYEKIETLCRTAFGRK